MSNKPSVAVWCDSPKGFAGFGKVAREIFGPRLDEWDLTFFSTNHEVAFEGADEFMPYIIDVQNNHDKMGRNQVLKYIHHQKPDFDVFFLLQDHFHMAHVVGAGDEKTFFIHQLKKMLPDTKIVSYFPVDAYPYAKWIEPVLRHSDKAVTYTDWARDKAFEALQRQNSDPDIKKNSTINVIEHGCDKHPHIMTEKERKKCRMQYFESDDIFIFGYVGTNSQRKNNIRDVLLPFFLTYKEHPEARLVLRCQMNAKANPPQGYSLRKKALWMCEEYDVPEEAVRFFNSRQKDYIVQDALEILYGVSDAIMLTSMEGWGLPISEAMSRKTLTITADHAGLSYVGGEGRSLQAEVPDTIDNRVYFPASNGMPRTQVSTKDLVDKMCKAIEMDEEERQEIIETAYEWTRENTWSDKAEIWKEKIEEMI